jgi:rRNA pseudouridine-1189 N-methylase Emg1 (Nep1/Mra1 family)
MVPRNYNQISSLLNKIQLDERIHQINEMLYEVQNDLSDVTTASAALVRPVSRLAIIDVNMRDL